jgi:hypothetical protein
MESQHTQRRGAQRDAQKCSRLVSLPSRATSPLPRPSHTPQPTTASLHLPSQAWLFCCTFACCVSLVEGTDDFIRLIRLIQSSQFHACLSATAEPPVQCAMTSSAVVLAMAVAAHSPLPASPPPTGVQAFYILFADQVSLHS